MYFGAEFKDCFDNIESRQERLFMVKDKWTTRELQTYLKPFTDPEIDAKFDVWL
jgi:hypothetical protein